MQLHSSWTAACGLGQWMCPELGCPSVKMVKFEIFFAIFFGVVFFKLLCFIQFINTFVKNYFSFQNLSFCWHFPSEKFSGFQSVPSEKFLGFQSKFRGRKRFSGPENIRLNPQTMKVFSKFSMLQAVFARILQSADKFCRIFPCKMSEFSMFYKKFGCMHVCILHVSSIRLTKVHTDP